MTVMMEMTDYPGAMGRLSVMVEQALWEAEAAIAAVRRGNLVTAYHYIRATHDTLVRGIRYARELAPSFGSVVELEEYSDGQFPWDAAREAAVEILELTGGLPDAEESEGRGVRE